MPYHSKIVAVIKAQPLTLGVRLGRWAVYLDVPAVKLARATGATRQSVYNWMKGGEVFVAYRPAVLRVIKCMESSQTAEEAWRKICMEFDLRT